MSNMFVWCLFVVFSQPLHSTRFNSNLQSSKKYFETPHPISPILILRDYISMDFLITFVLFAVENAFLSIEMGEVRLSYVFLEDCSNNTIVYKKLGCWGLSQKVC